MKVDEIIQKMEALTEDMSEIKGQMKDAEDGAKAALKSMYEGKARKFDELNADLEEAKRTEAMEKAKASRKDIDGKADVPEVEVADSDHNDAVHGKAHAEAFLAYCTDERSGDHAKAVAANKSGDNFVDAISTENGIKMPKALADFIAPQQTSVGDLENAMGKSVEDVFGKSTVLVREASGTNSGGGSGVNVDFEPTLFKTPKRQNAIPQKCWVKRAVGKQAQYPKLTQTTNQYGVVATWGNSGASSGEGSSITRSDPVQTRVDVNLERLALRTACSKRYLRNNDINFLSELAWMFRGTMDYQLGNAILEGVAGLSNAPQGINTNGSGVKKRARETAGQISYTDLVKMQFEVDDGIFGTGEYIFSAGSGGAMQYIAALDDSNGRPIFGGDSQSGWGVNAPGTIAGANYTNAKENTKLVGARGSAIYGNFMGYAFVIDSEDMAVERSDDFGFDTGEIWFRLITYAGGKVLGKDMFCLLDDVSTASSSSSSSSS